MAFTILLGVLVFLGTAIVDVIQAYAFEAYQKRDPNATSMLSVLEYAITFGMFYAFVAVSWWYAVPEVLGLIVGSQVSVRRIRAKEARLAAEQLEAPAANALRREVLPPVEK